MPLWLPFYEGADEHTKKLLGQISPATIGRHLDKFREVARSGLSSTNPSLIKNKIPIERLNHQIKEPGFIEADTVAHFGTSLAGDFVNTLTMMDVFTGWTETGLCSVKKVEQCLARYDRLKRVYLLTSRVLPLTMAMSS